MDDAFWHQRWEENHTPWDQGHTNVYLRNYVDRLELARGARVLVPLCGKAQDMQWLREHAFLLSAN